MYRVIGVRMPSEDNSKDHNKIYLDILTKEAIENAKPNSEGLYYANWWILKRTKLSGASNWEDLIEKEIVIMGTPKGKHTSNATITEVRVIK